MQLLPTQKYDAQRNVLVTDDDGGNTVVEFNPHFDFGDDEGEGSESDHNANLAEECGEDVLTAIASQLLLEIEEDDRSRSEWLQVREKALGMLGLKIQPPRGDVGTGGAPMEGMSSYQDSALLEAAIRFQSNARGELLPSGGPLKVENGGAPIQQNDAQAEALEKAGNEFLTVTATEYVPDTDRLFFQVGWAGCAFKKGFHCAIRRRPVIESVDAKDLIISNQATDIDNACRITHVIKMSKSVLIRMQIAGAYRDVKLIAAPTQDENSVDRKIASIQGVKPSTSLPENIDRTLYECYCDLDIPGYEHKLNGKVTGLPIPYKVTVDKASRQILEIRRNWKEGDEQCIKRRTFVMYPFIPWIGFYPLGLMHILGNATQAITSALRIILDNGMFSNFPGFIYNKAGGGQDKNDFRVAPGTGIAVNAPVGGKLSDNIMPLPYKPTDAAYVAFVEQLKENTSRLGGTAEIQVGEGNHEAPVGTTISLIEQAQKVMSAVHKRLHQAQAEELKMFQELLQEDPEALWRHKGKPPFNEQILRDALENYELVPRADPNIPSHMVRMAKAEALKQLVTLSPDQWDIKSVTEFYLDQIGLSDAKQFLIPPQPPQQPQVDPAAAAKAQSAVAVQGMKNAAGAQDRQLKVMELQQKAQSDAAERQSRETVQKLQLAKELAIHPLSQGIIENQNPGLAANVNP